MSIPALLVRLYPPAIRQRWGADIARELCVAGSRSWFDTVVGAGRLWLRPGDWPETADGQTRRVLLIALVTITTVLALVLRAAGSVPLTTGVGHVATSAWLALVLLGLALSMPLPPLGGLALGRLVAAAARTLAAPALALAALFVLAHSGLVGHPHGGMRVLLLGYYWSTLGFAGYRLCLLVARVSRIAIMPGTRRLRLALVFVGAGLALASAQNIAAILPSGPAAGGLVLSGGLAAIAAAVLAVGLDLRTERAGGPPPAAGRPHH
jgi:hypothetical protein